VEEKMSNLNEVMEALRNADAAGDAEAAKRLAEIADRMSKQTQAPAQSEQKGSDAFFGKGVLGGVGTAVDVVHKGMSQIPGMYKGDTPFMGTKWQEEKLGVPSRPPETAGEYVAQGVGEVTGLLLPGGAIAKGLSRGTGLAAKVADSVYKSMVKNPFLTAISELGGGAGAGFGRKVSEESDIGAVKSTAELGGGIVGAMTPTAIAHAPTLMAWKAGKHVLRKVSLPFSQSGSKYRAGEFVKSKVPKADEAITELGIETIGDLPPVVQAGENRLMNLHKVLMDKDPIADHEMIETLSKSAIKLEGEMRKLGYGSSELLADVSRKRIAALQARMDTRVLEATQKARDRLNKLPVAMRQSKESTIVKTELEKLSVSEYEEVKKIWREVNKDLPIGVQNIRKQFGEEMANLSEAEMPDMPLVLKNNAIIAKEGLTETTVREMQGLRSKLLEIEKIAGRAGKRNKSRIAGDMADAIFKDMETSSSDPNLLGAIEATRKYRDTFNKGVVGNILGYDRSGAPKIDMEAVLDSIIGKKGIQGAANISKVPMTPEIENSMKRYVTRSFTDYSLDSNGAINPAKAQKWMQNNEDVLDRFTDLRTQFSDASEAQKIATQTKATMDARKKALQDPRVSVASRFIETTDLGMEIDAVFKAKNPARMTNELVRQARKDPSGQAIEGVRASMVDYILEKSAKGGYNELGEKVISGNDMMGFLNKSEGVLRQVFTPEQMGRMKRIASEYAKIQKYIGASGRGEDIEMKDFASNALRIASRVVGAQVGGKMGAGTSGGSIQAAGIMSGRAKTFMNWLTKNRAEELIKDAITSNNPDLLKSLLAPLDKPATQKTNWTTLNKQLNLWLAGTGARVMQDMENEIREAPNGVQGFGKESNVMPETNKLNEMGYQGMGISP
jgi:hypothetical protein